MMTSFLDETTQAETDDINRNVLMNGGMLPPGATEPAATDAPTSEPTDVPAPPTDAPADTEVPTPTNAPTDTPAPTATVAPTADPSASATPAPTEPPYKEAYSKRKFLPTDKVKKYANYNTTLRRYEEFDVLTVTFRYSEKLPEGTTLRLVRVDTLLDDFGTALILPAELDGAGSDLLSAKIVSDRIPLNCASLRLEAVTPEGDVLFQADYYPDVKGYSADQARDFLDAPLETPAPSETPTP
jgi:hypothetical protein